MNSLNCIRLLGLLTILVMFSCNGREKKPENKRKASDATKVNVIMDDDKYYTRPFFKDTTNRLDGIERELTIQYTVWGCACANWITKEDRKKHANDPKYHFFLEPINDSVEKIEHNADALKNNIKVKGQFYVKKDFPENIGQHEEPIKKAKVFRYYDVRVLNNK